MTYGPPPDPNAPQPPPGAGDQFSNPVIPGPPTQPWGPPPEPQRPKGPWPGVVALLLGLAGCGLPFLPIDLTGVRHLIAFPLGFLGLLLGIVGCVGPRRGKPLAVAGIVWCVPVVGLGVYMIITFTLA